MTFSWRMIETQHDIVQIFCVYSARASEQATKCPYNEKEIAKRSIKVYGKKVYFCTVYFTTVMNKNKI